MDFGIEKIQISYFKIHIAHFKRAAQQRARTPTKWITTFK